MDLHRRLRLVESNEACFPSRRIEMSDRLKELLERNRNTTMTPQQREAQRQSFAYGNTKFENDRITRETVERASKELAQRNGSKFE